MAFTVFGKIICKETDEGVANLRVKAVDKDLLFDDLLGAVYTNDQGRFKIEYDEEDFKESFLDKKPDIFIKVLNAKGKQIYTSEKSVRYQGGTSEEFVVYLSKHLLEEEAGTMSPEDVSKVKEVMKRFDSTMVAAAIQTLDTDEDEVQSAKAAIKNVYDNMKGAPEAKLSAIRKAQNAVEEEVITAEVLRVKGALKEFDRDTILAAAAEFIGSAGFQYCISSECICPETDCIGPIARVDFDHSIYELEMAGRAQLKATQALQVNSKANAVVQVNNKIGFAGLCFDTVSCMGRQIQVMHGCLSSLYAFDINKESLVTSLLKMSEANPAIHKNLTAMIAEMEKNNEL